jgi:hypothetical protein
LARFRVSMNCMKIQIFQNQGWLLVRVGVNQWRDKLSVRN